MFKKLKGDSSEENSKDQMILSTGDNIASNNYNTLVEPSPNENKFIQGGSSIKKDSSRRNNNRLPPLENIGAPGLLQALIINDADTIDKIC
jgi:hypothetical protein